ncbi:MAG: ScyD/ScyE family protein [Actinomycetes bacterium]
MRRSRISLLAGVAALSTVAATLAGAAPSLAASTNVKITKVISGLNTPRGITFDGRGSMYVAESGVAGTGPAGLTHTGKVSKFARGSTHASWSTTFESLFATQDPSQPPDVLGPEGLSAIANSCRHPNRPHAAGVQGTDCQVRLIMSESHDGVAAVSGGAINATQLGHLYRLNARTGVPRNLSDVGDQMYKWTGDRKALFPDDFPDSNPFGVLVVRDKRHKIRTFVADAGANTISEVKRDGVLRVIAYIPNETKAPFRDATPTCIAQGPDGMLYVATLHFVAAVVAGQTGTADVWRVNPNANYPTPPKLWATGLTTATGCTFDRSGNFWAAEMFQPNASGPPGDVVRIPFKHPNRLTRIGGGKLPLAGGIAQGPDGAMYVTINSSSPTPGSGAVVKVRTSSKH